MIGRRRREEWAVDERGDKADKRTSKNGPWVDPIGGRRHTSSGIGVELRTRGRIGMELCRLPPPCGPFAVDVQTTMTPPQTTRRGARADWAQWRRDRRSRKRRIAEPRFHQIMYHVSLQWSIFI